MTKAIGILFFVIAFIWLYSMSHAQEHRHGPHVLPDDLGRWYSSWMRPDNRMISCCSLMDCEPTEARIVRGQWQAFSRRQNRWVDIPDSKIEREREVPVGAHLCENATGVLCFGVGGGT